MAQANGGPAFPFITSEGMSLRDYFAAAALHGVLAAEAHPRAHGAIPVDNDQAQFMALNCFKYADAMLKARELASPSAGGHDQEP